MAALRATLGELNLAVLDGASLKLQAAAESLKVSYKGDASGGFGPIAIAGTSKGWLAAAHRYGDHAVVEVYRFADAGKLMGPTARFPDRHLLFLVEGEGDGPALLGMEKIERGWRFEWALLAADGTILAPAAAIEPPRSLASNPAAAARVGGRFQIVLGSNPNAGAPASWLTIDDRGHASMPVPLPFTLSEMAVTAGLDGGVVATALSRDGISAVAIGGDGQARGAPTQVAQGAFARVLSLRRDEGTLRATLAGYSDGVEIAWFDATTLRGFREVRAWARPGLGAMGAGESDSATFILAGSDGKAWLGRVSK